ncbi:MAG: hypothetical protein ACHRXM_14695 [Isosphaerales bacterium]
MAAKRVTKKAEIIKAAPRKSVVSKKGSSAPKALKVSPSTPVKVVLSMTNGPVPDVEEAVLDTKSRIPNAATRRALADLKTGRVTRYVDADDLFRKLGVKVGKA